MLADSISSTACAVYELLRGMIDKLMKEAAEESDAKAFCTWFCFGAMILLNLSETGVSWIRLDAFGCFCVHMGIAHVR